MLHSSDEVKTPVGAMKSYEKALLLPLENFRELLCDFSPWFSSSLANEVFGSAKMETKQEKKEERKRTKIKQLSNNLLQTQLVRSDQKKIKILW